MDLRAAAAAAAQRNGVDPNLFLRLINQESGFNPQAVSRAGALGLAQLMPDTAAGLGVDPRDPLQNLEGGARYLRQQLDAFKDPVLALAAYNAGPGAVRKYGGVPPYAETQKYVRNIMGAAAASVGGGGGRIASSSGGTPAMGLMDFQQSPEPQTFKERLQEGIKSGALWDNLALAFNSMRLNPDQGIGQIVQSRQEQRAQERTANRTAQWLMSRGREDLARALLSGAVDAKTAAAVALTPPTDNRTALMQNYEYAISQGMTPAEARQWVSSGTTIQMPGQPTIGTIPAGYQAVKDETGSYRFEPIPGGPAETEVKTQANTKQALIEGAADSIDLIDSVLRDPALPSITGMIQGAMPPLTQAGTDLNVKIEQLKGQTFLRAFESLKGGGAITEREGAAAQAALARLNRAQSTAAYMAALTDLRTYLDRGRRRLAGENIPDAPLGGSGGITVGAPIE